MEHAHRIVIRTKKQDSAFMYHVLEGHEGVASYSTLDFRTADPHRDMELWVTQDFVADVKELLMDLGEMVEILTDANQSITT